MGRERERGRRRHVGEDITAIEPIKAHGCQRRDAGQIVHREGIVAADAVDDQLLRSADVETEQAEVRAIETQTRAVCRDRKYVGRRGAAVDLDGIALRAAFVDIRAVAVTPHDHVCARATVEDVVSGAAHDPVRSGAPVDGVDREAAHEAVVPRPSRHVLDVGDSGRASRRAGRQVDVAPGE